MKQKQLLTAVSEAGMNMHHNSAANPGQPRSDYPLEAGSDPPERHENGQDANGRRQQVEQLLRRGLSNKAIAGQLGMCEPTLKNYIRAIYHDAGVSTAREYFSTLLQSKD